ncbi:MAG: hypothetical protein GX065_06655, partial [Firmicutes bacterium]|nr:hypothetical protein [Bacillota bacterium]
MKKRLRNLQKKIASFRKQREYLVFQGIVLFIALLATVAIGIMPAQYELEEGEISPETIYASRTVIDQEATSLARAEAAEQVEDVYLYDAAVEKKVVNQVTALLVYLLELEPAAPPEPQPDEETEEDPQQEMAAQLLAEFPEVGDEEMALALLAIPKEDVQHTLDLTASTINTNIKQGKGIKPEEVEPSLQNIKTDLLQAQISPLLRDLVIVRLEEHYQPTRIYSPEETAAQRRRARDQVEDIVILKGAKIIDKGEAVTAAHLSQLRALGMLETSFAYGYYMGLTVLILCIFCAWGYYLYRYRPEILAVPSRIWIIGIIVILTLWAAKIFGGMLFEAGSIYLIPAAMAT